MNIFYLHKNPETAAKMMTDKHIVKMVLESAQILSTTHRVVDGEHYIDDSSGRRLQRWRHPKYESILYKATHFNHPTTKWVRESKEHYNWLYKHFKELSNEYTKRYHKVHKSWVKLHEILSFSPELIPDKPFTDPPLSMPDRYKCGDPVQSYRDYYRIEKLKEKKDIDRYAFWVLSEAILNYYGE